MSTEGQCDKHTASNVMTFFYRTDRLEEDEGLLDLADSDPWKTYRFEDSDGDLAEAWRSAVEWQCLLTATEHSDSKL